MLKPLASASSAPGESAAELYLLGSGARIRVDRLHPVLGLALALAFSASARPGAAQGDARADVPAGQSAAQASGRARFAAAMAHYGARRYREAIHEFQLSIAELPSADVWFNIARAHEQLGEYALAVEHYRLYLRDRVEAPDAAEVQQRIAELEQRARRAWQARTGSAPASGALAIDGAEPDSIVLLDGQQLEAPALQGVLHVDAGRHRLEVSRRGHVPLRAEVEVQPGALSVAYVQLQPLTRVRADEPARLWTWVAAGVSAAALLASGALHVAALDRRDAGSDRSAHQLGVASDVALAAGLGLAVGAVLLYFTEGPLDESIAAARSR
jgi:hypothetical protein